MPFRSTIKPTSAPSTTVSTTTTTEKSTTVMGLPVIQETDDQNSILFPTRNNQSNAIWQDQMDLNDVMTLIESQTHTEGKTFLKFCLCDNTGKKNLT